MKAVLKRPAVFLVFSLLFMAPSLPARAEILAAAASLQPALEKALPQFNREHGANLRGVYGASGNLVRQIENGAPFGLFLSADEKWARYAREKGLLDGDPLPFVKMPLVLWRMGSDAPSLGLPGSDGLRVAIANPETAPFGRMAKEYLQEKGFFEKIEKSGRLILGGDVLKTALAAQSGGADMAILPLSVALRLEGGKWTELDTPPQVLFGGLVKGKKTAHLEAFWAFLRSPGAEPVMKEFGFIPVDR
ncbi:molybdate transport system substrate-binding protein [Aminivibrio pyruvatiphilus]|uniref:Molybdate transport system substrate-binding protein n=1 Tax=Aminivibrio pyruvatiphilus TaxID=1005740 RepID=A0A4R8MBX4_9BACT|nr:molybdate ABC transporter substrate-binding protein [Aminivibrio pyruvatiphilus]TDY63259.1 molybdate transport system substrate-binding protein [Aminivibrio pyruvatiphilus]